MTKTEQNCVDFSMQERAAITVDGNKNLLWPYVQRDQDLMGTIPKNKHKLLKQHSMERTLLLSPNSPTFMHCSLHGFSILTPGMLPLCVAVTVYCGRKPCFSMGAFLFLAVVW